MKPIRKTWDDLTESQQAEYIRLDAAVTAAERASADVFFLAVAALDDFRELHCFDLGDS